LNVFKTIIFILAIILGIILQLLVYLIEPFSENGAFLQGLYTNLFYIPMLLILITFPRPTSVKGQILALNILVLGLVLASMNIDYQVLRIFTLPETLPPELIGTYVWDKTYNLYWVAWMFQLGMVFLIFALIYRFTKNDTWTAVRIGMVGPLMSFISFEDIIYYPMHGESPFGKIWDWLPQHNIYFGRPVNTVELIGIVSIGMAIIFLFLVGFAIKKKAPEEDFKSFSNLTEKHRFQWIFPLTIGVFCGFVLLYLNTNIINDRIPFYLLLTFAGILVIFTLFSTYFPKIKSTFRQLLLIFGGYIVFWFAAAEMDWHAVEAGFHWIIPGDPRKPPGDFWIWADYRMAMWLIYLPIILLLISVMFKMLGQSQQATLKLSITNFLILFMGLDSILIFFLAGFLFPPHWTWSNLHYSLFNGAYSLPLLIGFAVGISLLLVYLHKKIKLEK
jgi:hypothetical protein